MYRPVTFFLPGALGPLLLMLALFVPVWLAPGVASAQLGGTDLSLRAYAGDGAPTAIGQVCCGPENAVSWSVPEDRLRSRYGGRPFWVKIDGVPGSGLIQFKPTLDEVTLYARARGASGWQVSRTGDLVPGPERALRTPDMVLRLPGDVDPDAVYALIDQPTRIAISAIYWTEPAFLAAQDAERTLMLFLLGFISAIILYNLVVSVLVRDPVYALNALCITALMVLSLYLSGYGAIYLWPRWYQYTNAIAVAAIFGGVLFGAAFIYLFLRNPEDDPRRNWPIFVAPALAATVSLVLLAIRAPYWTIQLTVLASAGLLLVIVGAIMIARAISGERRARILLVPFLVAIGPGMFFVALNKIGGYGPKAIGDNVMEVTLAMEAILFSLALASRIRVTEAANREATMQLLRSRQRNATIALTAQDDERQRLAKELHDSVGQDVLMIVTRLKRLAADPAASAFRNGIANIADAATAAMDNLRRISRAMHPASLEHVGLEATIRELVDQLNAAEGIDFKTSIALDGADLPRQHQLHIFRIAQECLSNVVRHSQASRCTIDMRRDDRQLAIVIEDDGTGLAPGIPNGDQRFGLGLISVDERVRSLGGSWRMEAARPSGVRVRLSVPLDPMPAPGQTP